MRYLWKQRSAVHVMAASALTALWGWGLMYWTPMFLNQSYGLSSGQAGAITGKIHLFGGGAATIFTGLAPDAAVHGRPATDRKADGLVDRRGEPGLVCDLHDALARLVQILFWFFIPSIYFYIGPCFGLLLNLAEPRMRAVFCAATLFAANFLQPDRRAGRRSAR